MAETKLWGNKIEAGRHRENSVKQVFNSYLFSMLKLNEKNQPGSKMD